MSNQSTSVYPYIVDVIWWLRRHYVTRGLSLEDKR